MFLDAGLMFGIPVEWTDGRTDIRKETRHSELVTVALSKTDDVAAALKRPFNANFQLSRHNGVVGEQKPCVRSRSVHTPSHHHPATLPPAQKRI